jgi:CHAT domain-containing protein/Tfp pilus assembly protein PilF
MNQTFFSKNRNLMILLNLICLGLTLNTTNQILAIAPPPQIVQETQNRDSAEKAFRQGMESYQKATISGFKEAIALWETALQLWQTIGDASQSAVTLNFLSLAYANLGQFSKALKGYQQLLLLTQTLKDQQTEASTLVAIAKIEAKLGNYQQSLDGLNQSLALWQKIKFKTGEATALNEIALIHFNLGESKQAINYYNQALQSVSTLGNSANTAAILNNLGQVYSDSKEFDKALDYYQQSASLWENLIEKLGDNASPDIKRGKSATLNNIAFIYTNLEKFPSALETYQQALTLWQTIGDRTGEASTLNNMGFVYFQQGNLTKARDFYQQALNIRQEVGDLPKEAISRYRLAMIDRKQSNFEQAIQQINRAIEIIENLRIKVTNQDLRTSFLASKQEYYQFYIDLLMQLHQQNPHQGWDGKALQISERSKARSLLDILAESQGQLTKGIDPKLLAQKNLLKEQLGNLEEKRIQLLSNPHTDDQQQAMDREIDTLLQQYEPLLEKIRLTNSHYASLTQPQTLNLAKIQHLLDNNTTLLEYSLGEERSYLWVVQKKSIQSYTLGDRATIETAVKDFRNSFISPTKRIRRSLTETTGEKLSQIILPDIKNLKNKRLLIVADGALQYLPFAALPDLSNTKDKPTFLMEKHELISLPSASTLGILRQETQGRKPAKKLLAMLADPVFSINDERLKNVVAKNITPLAPDLERSARESGVLFDRLPYTQTEAQQILSLIPVNQRLQESGFSANKETSTSGQLGQYRFIHFATHGLLNSQNPQLSGLVLSLVEPSGKSTNGFLRLYDIFNLNLPAELVVLSACQTGLGKEIKGEGIIGLTRGFMYAGATRVLVSLWSVDDQATSVLMVNFYQGMLKKKLSPAEALRQAQIDLQKNPDWSSPYYWAAFTLQGEWKEINSL